MTTHRLGVSDGVAGRFDLTEPAPPRLGGGEVANRRRTAIQLRVARKVLTGRGRFAGLEPKL